MGKAVRCDRSECQRTVHPHTRGESGFFGCGESFPPRFTPTLVGKAFLLLIRLFHGAVHPHTRGESAGAETTDPRNLRFTPTLVGKALPWGEDGYDPNGSPPHSWGKRNTYPNYNRPIRFTPTLVGKASSGNDPTARHSGSPPHSWGKRRDGVSWLGQITVHPHTRGESCVSGASNENAKRFTPTLVGKAILAGCRDHAAEIMPVAGSPPHSWGKRLAIDLPNSVSAGSPPHSWGKRHITSPFSQGLSVHPHTRGESVNSSQ